MWGSPQPEWLRLIQVGRRFEQVHMTYLKICHARLVSVGSNSNASYTVYYQRSS